MATWVYICRRFGLEFYLQARRCLMGNRRLHMEYAVAVLSLFAYGTADAQAATLRCTLFDFLDSYVQARVFVLSRLRSSIFTASLGEARKSCCRVRLRLNVDVCLHVEILYA
jgi:hypothetical protein